MIFFFFSVNHSTTPSMMRNKLFPLDCEVGLRQAGTVTGIRRGRMRPCRVMKMSCLYIVTNGEIEGPRHAGVMTKCSTS